MFYYILGSIAEMIYYDVNGYIHIKNRYLINWIEEDARLTNKVRRRILKKFKGFTRKDVVSNVIEQAHQLYKIKNYQLLAKVIFNEMNMEILSNMYYADWLEYAKAVYSNGYFIREVNILLSKKTGAELLRKANTILLLTDVLRYFRNYSAAELLLWILEGEATRHINEFAYLNTVYYGELLRCYTDADDFINGMIICRHLAFVIQNNKGLPPSTNLMRFNVAEPVYYFGKHFDVQYLCEFAENISKETSRIDGVNIVFENRISPVYPFAEKFTFDELEDNNFHDAVFFVLGTVIYSPDESSDYKLEKADGKLLPVSDAEFKALTVIREIKSSAKSNELIKENRIMIYKLLKKHIILKHRKNDYFGLYGKIASIKVMRNGMAVGEQGENTYVIYRLFKGAVNIEQPEYLFWLYAENRTVAEIFELIARMFKNPDTMKIQKEVAESAVSLDRLGLIRFIQE